MATYKQLLKRSLRIIGAVPKGMEPAQEDIADAFEALGYLFDEMSSERFGIYTVPNESFTLTASDNSYSIGSGADLDTARPKKILTAYIRQNDTDYPVEIIAREDYARIADKTDTGRPYYLYYEESYPNGRVDLYPTPDQAYSLHIESWKELTKPTDVTDTVALPSEYINYIVPKMAITLAPEYGRQVDQVVYNDASKALRRLKNIHASNVPRLNTDILGSTSYYEYQGDIFI